MVTTESFCYNHKASSERGALSLGRVITELQSESDRITDATQFSQLKVLSSTEPKSIQQQTSALRIKQQQRETFQRERYEINSCYARWIRLADTTGA